MLPDIEDPRFNELGPEGFTFACHPEVPCFNECCRRLNLVLTPYDVLRLKNHLGLSSEEFIERHTVVESGQNGWPLPRLAMADNDEQTCPSSPPGLHRIPRPARRLPHLSPGPGHQGRRGRRALPGELVFGQGAPLPGL